MPTTLPSDAAMDLQTISDNGQPPKRRLDSAKHAEDVYWLLKDAALPRHQKAAVTQGMFNGNAPYAGSVMRKRGEGWRANFNTLEAASRKDSAKSPFYDLLTSAPAYADCETTISTETMTAAEASRVRTDNFHTLLSSYGSFHMAWWEMLDGFIGFNKGFLWWPQMDSWHFECMPWQKVFFPDGTGINPDKWELFVIEHNWPVHQLWNFVRDESTAKAAGYNRKQVIKAIRGAVPRDLAGEENPMQLQQAMRDSELYTSMASRTVQAASVYVREFDGKWSRMMVTTESRSSDSSKSSARPMSPAEASMYQQGKAGEQQTSKLKKDDWLYYKQGVGDNIWQILCPFIYEPEDGSINTVSGLGKRILSVMQVKDRMRCSQVDNVFLGTQIIMQAQTGGGHAKQGKVQIGGGVVTLPPGFAVQQAGVIGNVEPTLAVNNDLDRMLDSNTGTYRPQFEKPTGNPETARAADIRFTQSTVLSNSSVLRFYVQADKFYEECYRRAVMPVPKDSKDPAHVAAREFQKACRDAGLSDKQIQDIQSGFIRSMRTIGNGSPGLRQQNMVAMQTQVPFMGPRGLNNFKIDFAAAYVGQRGANRYFPKEDLNQIPTRDDYDAVGENADFQTGGQVMFADWQDHESHARTHLAAGVGAIQAVLQGGADPATPFTFLQSMLPHVAQHIQKVPRKQVREELQAAFREIAQGMKQVEQAAMETMKQAQESGANGNGIPPEVQAKIAEAQAKLQIDAQKAQHDMALDEKKLEHEIQLDEKRFEHEEKQAEQELEFQREKQGAEIQMQRQKMTQEGQMMRQKMTMQREQARNKSNERKAD